MNADQAPVFKRLFVIGVGLIGGSVCLAAKQNSMAKYILGYSRRLETVHKALSLNLIDECITDPSDPNLRGVDGVLLAVPVRQYESVLRRFLPVLPAGALIFDAGSTKHDVLAVIRKLTPDFPNLSERFVLSHPIAGGEKHGPEAADASLFRSKTCVLCPTERVDGHRFEKVKAFWETAGAKIQTMDPNDHDEMYGAVSHLPHFLAFAYVAGVLTHPKGKEFMREGGAGFRDFTRIAASSAEMWADIFQNNDVALLGMLDRFEQITQEMRAAITKGDRARLDAVLLQASDYRSRWRAKSAAASRKKAVKASK